MGSVKDTRTKRSKAAWRRHCARVATKMFFKLIEMGVVVAYIIKIIFELPDGVRNSGKHLKEWIALFVNPRFMFFLGNAIIITLFIKSGHNPGLDRNRNSITDDIYQEFVERTRSRQRVPRHELDKTAEKNMSVNEGMSLTIARQSTTGQSRKKQSICQRRPKQNVREKRSKQSTNETRMKQIPPGEDIKGQSIGENGGKQSPGENIGQQNTSENGEERSAGGKKEREGTPETEPYRRTQSENFRHHVDYSVISSPELKRSGTERFGKGCDLDARIAAFSYPEDSMSNEEFRLKVEAFISRQRKYQQSGDEDCVT